MYEKMDIDERLRDRKKEKYSIVTLENLGGYRKNFFAKL